MDDVDVGARIAAARLLAGKITQRELARRIDTPGLGEETIKSIEQGSRQLRTHEAPLFAAALGTTVDFIYDREERSDALAQQIAGLEQRLAAIEQHLSDGDQSIKGQLRAQDRLLADLRALVQIALARAASGDVVELTDAERAVLGIVSQVAPPANVDPAPRANPGQG